MDILDKSGYSLRNLNKVNVIIGKNGCGKSTLLKQVETSLNNDQNTGHLKYITPERGGALIYEPGVETNMTRNQNWLNSVLRKNQFFQFREQSVTQYRKLELLTLREIESIQEIRSSDATFENVISKINGLLDNIYITREGSHFKIFNKSNNDELKADAISSGESELISLGIECLVFEKESKNNLLNILFLDEPDVHLHPDLQSRFAKFLQELVSTEKFIVIMATHSTAMLGAFSGHDNVSLGFMASEQKDIQFHNITNIYKKILPVFGAHPLSNVFNEAPILLVEGEDDERIWQQAVRSSEGRIKIYPCSVEGIDNMDEYENDVIEIINSVYDNAKAFSLRDRDEEEGELQDKTPLIKFRLACRSAENLLLSNEVLDSFNITWAELQLKIDNWLNRNTDHKNYTVMTEFKSSGYLRKTYRLKQIRNDLMGIIGSPKPWEVAVGQVIGRITPPENIQEDSIFSYLGSKITNELLLRQY